MTSPKNLSQCTAWLCLLLVLCPAVTPAWGQNIIRLGTASPVQDGKGDNKDAISVGRNCFGSGFIPVPVANPCNTTWRPSDLVYSSPKVDYCGAQPPVGDWVGWAPNVYGGPSPTKGLCMPSVSYRMPIGQTLFPVVPPALQSFVQVLYPGDPTKTKVELSFKVYRNAPGHQVRWRWRGARTTNWFDVPRGNQGYVKVDMTLTYDQVTWGRPNPASYTTPIAGDNWLDIDGNGSWTNITWGRAEVKQPHTVWLVHGMNASHKTWQDAGYDLMLPVRHGGPVFAINHGAAFITDGGVIERARKVSEIIHFTMSGSGHFTFFSAHHSAGGLVMQRALGGGNSVLAGYDIPVMRDIGSPKGGSAIADLSTEVYGGAELTPTSPLGNGTPGALAPAVMHHLYGAEPRLVRNLRQTERTTELNELLDSGLPRFRWGTPFRGAPRPAVDAYAHRGDANWGEPQVNITGAKTIGFAPAFTASMMGTIYQYAGTTVGLSLTTERVPTPTIYTRGGVISVGGTVSKKIAVPTKQKNLSPNDFLVTAERGVSSSYWRTGPLLNANHSSLVPLVRDEFIEAILRAEAVYVYRWIEM